MADATNRQVTEMTGPLAIPRQNGEPTFESPWESRAFGMAVVLNEKAVYPWRDFSQTLAAEIADAETQGIDSSYYERWYATLEKLVLSKGLLKTEELTARMDEFKAGLHDDHASHPHDHHHH